MAAYSGTATVSHTFWACRRCFSTLFPAFTRGRGARYTLARFEGLAPQEQARHLASADILLAPHGSALGWMPLLPHGAVALIAWGSGADYIKPGEVDYPCLGTWMDDVHVPLPSSEAAPPADPRPVPRATSLQPLLRRAAPQGR